MKILVSMQSQQRVGPVPELRLSERKLTQAEMLPRSPPRKGQSTST